MKRIKKFEKFNEIEVPEKKKVMEIGLDLTKAHTLEESMKQIIESIEHRKLTGY